MPIAHRLAVIPATCPVRGSERDPVLEKTLLLIDRIPNSFAPVSPSKGSVGCLLTK